MAKQASPVGFKELLQLTQHGIGADTIKFKNVTLSSDKYVCVREEGAATPSLAIMDVATSNVLRLPVDVDSAIMNPVSKVVALRSGQNLQIYNLEMKTKMKATAMTEPVAFWTWLDAKTVAIVTDKNVYHWSMDGDAQPTLMFARAAVEGAVQVINYQASADGKWLIVGGITASGGGIKGVLQVYSVAMKASQPTMDAHAACFASVVVDGKPGAEGATPSQLFCFAQKTPATGAVKLQIIQLGVAKADAFTQSADIAMAADDFPVSMVCDKKYGCLFVVSKAGVLYLYEIQSGKCIFQQQASRATMFASCAHSDDGLVAVDQSGRVSHFFVERASVVGHMCSVMNDYDLGVKFAKRHDLPGAENLFTQQFQRLMQGGRVPEAIALAVASPQGILRNSDTINALKAAPATPGQTSHVLSYFQLLLAKGTLNEIESVELVRPVLAQGNPAGVKHIEDWLKQNKLAASEELGDLLKTHNVTLALSVYLRGKCAAKVVGCFCALGAQESDDDAARAHFDNIIAYAKRVDYKPDFVALVKQLQRVNADRAKDLALLLLNNDDAAFALDVHTLVAAFLEQNDVKNTTNILLEYLKPRGDREEDAALQSQLLEINLQHMPQVADAIFESDDYVFTHYDKTKIAQLCERAQLYQRALQHYTDLDDIKRVLTNTHMISPDYLLEYFGRMSPDDAIDCLTGILTYNLQQNIRLVVAIAKKWSDYITPQKLIALFEKFESYNGLFFYLGALVNECEDESVVFKFIEAAVQLNQLKEAERVCRDHDHYDAVQVKTFLFQANLKDPRPLIHVCDRFNFVNELTQYLYTNNMYMFIEAYVQRMNPKATPAVVGGLIDLNASDEQIKQLMNNVRAPVDSDEEADAFFDALVSECERRNRLKLLRSWMEARRDEKCEATGLHNGLGKIYVEVNNAPAAFLRDNPFYDSAVVGAFCESRDPHLAVVAYTRAAGSCDEQLVRVCNQNGFYKDLARHLVKRQDLVLWATCLSTGNDDDDDDAEGGAERKCLNEHRRPLIDQVVATALPESRVPDEVSTTVKAFMAARLPHELIELLERLILHGPSDGEFRQNRNLQNLLILTAIKADARRVMEYIGRLDNYDGPDIAKIAVSEQYELFEEAFAIYKKFEMGAEAISVLVHKLKALDRALEFAKYWNKPDVWFLLARAQLDAGFVTEAIDSYLQSNDAAHYVAVIAAARAGDHFVELISYLQMARATGIKQTTVDNELLYAFAKTDRLADMEEFLTTATHMARAGDVGDACFCEGNLYEAARVLYTHCGNTAKLALCLVKLQLFTEAVAAATQANSLPTWKAVCFACVDFEQFRLAAQCGVHVIVYMDHLLDVLHHYELNGHFSEVIALLEQGIQLERAHQALFTQLGRLYARYAEARTLEHCKLYWSRLNIPSMLSHCRENQLWPCCVFLYNHYDQFEQACTTMVDHHTECWSHDTFKESLKQCANTELWYKSAIPFYFAVHPELVVDLCIDLTSSMGGGHSHTLDHARVLKIAGDREHGTELIQRYLQHVQTSGVNDRAVNDAVNALAVADEDVAALTASIDANDAFDAVALAQRLETHDLLSFRRVAGRLYRAAGRYDVAIALSKKDGLWEDAMTATAASGDQTLCEELCQYFVDARDAASFAACLYTCAEHVRPDRVLEWAWRSDGAGEAARASPRLMTAAMPFLIQTLATSLARVTALEERFAVIDARDHEASAAAAAAAEQQQKTDASYVGQHMHGPYNPMMAPLALAAPPSYGNVQQYTPAQQGNGQQW